MRGGGLYACGFAVTFLWLEAGSFIDDFKQIHLLFEGQVFDFVLNFIIDSFKNTIAAFMWPLSVFQLWQPFGAIALLAAYFAFPVLLKPRIEHWLFDGQPPPEKPKKNKRKA